MSLWNWIVVGAGALFALSVVLGVALAAILGAIARESSSMAELEAWTALPITRSRDAESLASLPDARRQRRPVSRL